MTALVWFRRDLRIHDHPALHAAVAGHARVVPVFCLDDRLLRGRHASGARTAFLLESLADLDGGLRALGSRLLVWRGRPEEVLPTLARVTGATEIHATRDVTPFARVRGRGVGGALEEAGVRFVAHPGLTVVQDVTALRTRGGTVYGTFTPFHRTWEEAERRRPLPPPSALPPPVDGLEFRPLPTLGELGLAAEVTQPQAGGETAALARAEWFLDGPVARYARTRDLLDVDGTSKLGAYLHFGCISARGLEARLGAGTGAEAFRRQLCWRDFHHYVQYHHPENARLEHQERYRGTISWVEDDGRFGAWAAGRTGFPLVDAAMRQLLREGWMHNRARMLVGCFLTKHLGIDWRRGEAFFMRMLLDGDQANNNGNWQWIASVGVDPQPVFRRLYNPTAHQERYDPSGRYVREYLPELRQVPDAYLAEPWRMPDDVQRSAGCVIGRDYPAPIVDLREARELALARYREATAATA